jgi:hypothetical protein
MALLNADYDTLKSAVTRYLGMDSYDELDADSQAVVDGIINSGLRRFYYPPKLKYDKTSHEWSFLKPVESITTVADTGDYNLPSDYAGIEGSITFKSETVYPPIAIIGEGQIRHYRQTYTSTGRPKFAAVRPKSSDGASEQQFELMLWPTPDDDYELEFSMNLQLDTLSDANPHPYGGAVHAETIIQSCLAVAEVREEDITGPQWEVFMERLEASIQHDKRTSGQEYFGKMRNIEAFDDSDFRRSDIVTYDGEYGH